MNSIAYENGFFWKTLWDASENAGLKDRRKDPNILFPGDTVTIPDPRENYVSRSVGKRHRFQLKGVPARICIQLWWGEELRRDQPYELEIDGKVASGKTDQDGHVRMNIPPNAKKGTLTVGAGLRKSTYSLVLGALDPISEITGAQARLNNLGFFCGPENGELNYDTEAALRAFQDKHKLDVTGELDQPTLDKLQSAHQGR